MEKKKERIKWIEAQLICKIKIALNDRKTNLDSPYMVSLRWQPLHTVTSSLVGVVSKPLMGLTNLNQALICTPSLNLTNCDGV